MMTKVPDGKGGWVDVDAEVHVAPKLDLAKQAEARGQAWVNEAAGLTETSIKFVVRYAKDNNLVPEQVAFAFALALINMRHTFPLGLESFDKLCVEAQAYYDANVDKVRK